MLTNIFDTNLIPTAIYEKIHIILKSRLSVAILIIFILLLVFYLLYVKLFDINFMKDKIYELNYKLLGMESIIKKIQDDKDKINDNINKLKTEITHGVIIDTDKNIKKPMKKM